LTSRRSQGHFCSFLGTDQQKAWYSSADLG
jgi:hypothetical protein